MGMNTPVLIVNDAWQHIMDDYRFGRKLYDASMVATRDKPADVATGGHANAAKVLSYAHADNTRLIAIGGNCTSELLSLWNGGVHHTEEAKIILLRELADSLGYSIARKRKK